MKKTAIALLAISFLALETEAQDFDIYGEAFSPYPTVTVDSLKSNSIPVQVEGTVEAVCPVKGCWMKLKLDNGQSMRVSFKDYGFFVPKNMPSGTKVIIKGIPEVRVISVKELKHFAEDAGRLEEEIETIRTPQKELTFVADGVLVSR